MLYTDMTIAAMKIAYLAHEAKFDKYDVPYIYHPIHLAEQMDCEVSICVALLHDVLEDSFYEASDLYKMGISHEVIAALELLTHAKSESYQKYIQRIADSGNAIAKKVKLADLHHNSDEARLDCLDDKTKKRLQKKYKAAIKTLS